HRPPESGPDERGAEDRAGDRDLNGAPGPRRQPGGIGRLVDLEDTPQARRVEDLPDFGRQGRQPHRALYALRGRVAAYERADSRAVDGRHAAEIEDQVAVAAAIELPELGFE